MLRKCLIILAAVIGCLGIAAPQIASATPATSGWQCTGGTDSQCGQVVGAGLHISYLHWGLYNKIFTSRWCGFIEVIEQTANRSWTDVQYTGTVCSNVPSNGTQGNININVNMPGQGYVYEYAIPAPGYPGKGVNVFNIY